MDRFYTNVGMGGALEEASQWAPILSSVVLLGPGPCSLSLYGSFPYLSHTFSVSSLVLAFRCVFGAIAAEPTATSLDEQMDKWRSKSEDGGKPAGKAKGGKAAKATAAPADSSSLDAAMDAYKAKVS